MKAIEIIGLNKYYGKSRGIENVNLSIAEGEIFGFIGPNGAGKSTTIRTLLNFIHPTSGKAKIFGLDIVNDTKEIKKLIGYVPSEISFYDDMKVKELFKYSAQFYGQNFSERIDQLVEIFEVDLNRNLADLSFGNKKKVAIIQALLHQPKLLILDEPTSGLDPLMQSKFFELLQKENQLGMTIFFSSHILNEVQKVCHRVAIIKDGEIIEVEEIEKLRKRNYKKVTLELLKKQQEVPFQIAGMTNISVHSDNTLISFMFQGNINELTQQFADIQLKNLWLEEPTLEEIFMHYYEQEGAK